MSLQLSAAGSIHCSSWKKGLNEHKYHYKSGSCISSAMLWLTKNHRIVITRFPDCILILIHWLLSTSVHWEPNCNKHLKKPPWWALWSGRKLISAWNCLNPTCKATLEVQCDLAAAGNDRAIFWVIQAHNSTGLTHGELHPLQTCLLHCIPSSLTPFWLWETPAGSHLPVLYLGMAVPRDTFISQLMLRCLFSW